MSDFVSSGVPFPVMENPFTIPLSCINSISNISGVPFSKVIIPEYLSVFWEKTEEVYNIDKTLNISTTDLTATKRKSTDNLEAYNLIMQAFKHINNPIYTDQKRGERIKPLAERAEENLNIILEQEKRDETSLQEIKDKSVYVKDLDIPIKSMVIFMVKWALASIPAFIILAIIGAIFFAIFTAIFVSTRWKN